uniref:Transposon TX1 uncharacterized n=1 Tax=Cajanus cajan TaxID=3821 RepID=A0A151S3Q9_CAJCA|nr:Transposon TX1 uncharacterized [Cajanus cajan]
MYKVLAKLLANRFKKVIGHVISECQSAFLKGRLIFDSVVVANEILEESCLFFKVDFEKAYDSVNWGFLQLVMERMGFPLQWRRWIAECLSTFLWGGDDEHRKLAWVSWDEICKDKHLEGLGLRDFRAFNLVEVETAS